jgi:hypothetical protein
MIVFCFLLFRTKKGLQTAQELSGICAALDRSLKTTGTMNSYGVQKWGTHKWEDTQKTMKYNKG